MKMNWSEAAFQLSNNGQAYVLVTIVGVTGSTPRDSGTKMVVTENEIYDTIGGGHLEYKVMSYAQKLLSHASRTQHQQLEQFKLGSQLGQCCGGSANMLFEYFPAVGINIMVFGAGHVGRTLIPLLAQLPAKITWVDSRADQFPTSAESNRKSQYFNVKNIISEQPADEVSTMPENSYFIVMTHNHQMDFEISKAILKRGDFHYHGLIASQTKWQRFQQRYEHHNISADQVKRIKCPIGVANVSGKRPMEIAISVAAEIIETYQIALNNKVDDSKITKKGVHWKELKAILSDLENESEKLNEAEYKLASNNVIKSGIKQ